MLDSIGDEQPIGFRRGPWSLHLTFYAIVYLLYCFAVFEDVSFISLFQIFIVLCLLPFNTCTYLFMAIYGVTLIAIVWEGRCLTQRR